MTGNMIRRAMPPGGMPPGAMPPGAMPPGAMPPGSMPPRSMQPGMMQAGGSMPEEGETEPLSYNKRNVLKWEKDELLGDLATTSPVLYANMTHPDLKSSYPGMCRNGFNNNNT